MRRCPALLERRPPVFDPGQFVRSSVGEMYDVTRGIHVFGDLQELVSNHAAVFVQLNTFEKIGRWSYSDADNYQVYIEEFAALELNGFDPAMIVIHKTLYV